MITFGLTGNIACGKSTVEKTMLKHGIPIIDADKISRQVVEPGTSGLNAIVEVFGEQYLQQDGTLDRTKLGELVFSNKDELRALNSIMEDRISKEADSQIEDLHTLGYALAGYSAALLVEIGQADRYRPLIVVACGLQQQIDRLMKRNGLTERQAMDRISSQLPTEKKVAVADYVITTDGSIDSSVEQTETIINTLYGLL